jgi:hypothetical protein
MAVNRSNVTEMREDLSRFVVHLTRNDKTEGGATARKNFLDILEERTILASRSHCLHGRQVHQLTKAQQKSFKVACFTEVPLNQIRFLTRKIDGRSIKLSSYGFVFSKKFLIEKGAQPAIYINNYSGNTHLREAVDRIWERAKADDFTDSIWRLLPFVNIMHSGYDFTWEREWRTRGPLKFRLKDLVCAILPGQGDDDIRERLAKSGIAAISPKWTYERIVQELASQQRRTKTITLNGLSAK